ncbi:MAG: hypothetical protein AAF772_03060 [Acidobacteriota bacterium]
MADDRSSDDLSNPDAPSANDGQTFIQLLHERSVEQPESPWGAEAPQTPDELARRLEEQMLPELRAYLGDAKAQAEWIASSLGELRTTHDAFRKELQELDAVHRTLNGELTEARDVHRSNRAAFSLDDPRTDESGRQVRRLERKVADNRDAHASWAMSAGTFSTLIEQLNSLHTMANDTAHLIEESLTALGQIALAAPQHTAESESFLSLRLRAQALLGEVPALVVPEELMQMPEIRVPSQ